jgi:uncharacterized RDD family membrane protein YckC
MRVGLLALMTLLAAPGAHAQGIDIHVNVTNPSVRVFQNYTLRAGESARQVVVIGGDAIIEGHVDEDVVVVLGKVQLSSTASIDRSLVVTAGTAVIAEGARVRGDLVVVGTLQAPPSFEPGGQQVAVSTLGIDEQLRGLLPWLTRGLLLMRIIVPGLWWVWAIAGVFFLVNLLINVVLDPPVTSCTTALRTTPLSAFLTGLLVLLLIGPASVLLAISVVGIVVIPFLNLAVLLAAIIGRVAFARWLGMSLTHQIDLGNRRESLQSFVVGSAIMCIAYMIPVIGLVTWCLAGVFGLGAATQAFFRAYRREHPKPPPQPAPSAPPPAPAPEPESRSFPLQAEGSANAPPADLTPTVDLPPKGGSYESASSASLLSFPRADFMDRLAAFGVDFIVVAVITAILGVEIFGRGPTFERHMLLIGLAYHVGFWTWKATTVGGILMQLRVVRADGGPLGFGEAFVRGLAGILSLIVVGVGFLWILRDPERQAWHDRIAGTYVVKVPRSWPV